jgi:hypothetical protein
MRRLAALTLLAAACGQNDNLIVGGVSSGSTTPEVIFDNIASAIHGVATMRDSTGNPVGDPMAVVIMSDVPGLCTVLNQHRDFFRNAPQAYEALVLIVPNGYLGTFIIGRQGVDTPTAAEIVAASGPQVTTPFHGLQGSYISVTEFGTTGGEASGNFNMLFDDPYGSGVAHPFYGRFKTGFCPGLEGTLLP